MKSRSVSVIAVLIVCCATMWAARAPGSPPQIDQGEHKEKVKHGKLVDQDKSKPVRKAIDDWYARNIAAFEAKDVAAITALRTDDFHTMTPDGKVNTRADMEARARNSCSTGSTTSFLRNSASVRSTYKAS
ncbi:MAG TPA: hypothetical protein VGN90_04815 [Pyrinomonadaceae bacterium]|nr:hypothetical protein [Pyrinomonadaceae bacterium]